MYLFWHSGESAETSDIQISFTPASYNEGIQGQLEKEPGMTVALGVESAAVESPSVRSVAVTVEPTAFGTARIERVRTISARPGCWQN